MNCTRFTTAPLGKLDPQNCFYLRIFDPGKRQVWSLSARLAHFEGTFHDEELFLGHTPGRSPLDGHKNCECRSFPVNAAITTRQMIDPFTVVRVWQPAEGTLQVIVSSKRTDVAGRSMTYFETLKNSQARTKHGDDVSTVANDEDDDDSDDGGETPSNDLQLSGDIKYRRFGNVQLVSMNGRGKVSNLRGGDNAIQIFVAGDEQATLDICRAVNASVAEELNRNETSR